MNEGYQYGPPAQRNDPQYVAYLEQRIAALEARLPRTKVVAPGFLTRAFAIWGHMFVANLLISIVVSIVMGILSIIIGGSIAAMIDSMQSSY